MNTCTQQREIKKEAYDEVSSLIGAGEESGWMSFHLVLESGRSAIFCLSSQSVPELICEEDTQIQLRLSSVAVIPTYTACETTDSRGLTTHPCTAYIVDDADLHILL